MKRLAPTLVVVVLLGATAVAFTVTQNLKLERSPILSPRIDRVFSPTCDCGAERAPIEFRLRRPDTVTLAIVDEDERVVRTLLDASREGNGVFVRWDGRDDEGRLVGEGLYRPRVRLASVERTFLFPNEIEVDLTAPTVELLGVGSRVISPDGDGRAEGVAVRYRVSEPARALLLVNGKRRVRSRLRDGTGSVEWYGRIRGRPARPGIYRLALFAVDRAGNRSRQMPAGYVTVRYLRLDAHRFEVRARTRFAVGVDTDAAGYEWLFARGRGRADGDVLVLRAPRRPGRYRLYVEANGRADTALIIVRRR